jgi:hypothetical protein
MYSVVFAPESRLGISKSSATSPTSTVTVRLFVGFVPAATGNETDDDDRRRKIKSRTTNRLVDHGIVFLRQSNGIDVSIAFYSFPLL